MGIQTETGISKIKIREKIETFLENNEESLLEEEKQQLIEELSHGKIPDLSGVTAIRGFVYQYYVAANYIIDMLFSPEAWWDKVVFEYLDDITVMGNQKIRFVQVKTKRESDEVNHLTLGEIHKRKNGKGSWLDKLFLLNTHVPDSRNSMMVLDKELIASKRLQFELATNVQYNKDVALYAKEDTFNNNRSDKEYQPLIGNLEKDDMDWNVKVNGKDMKFNINCYNDGEVQITKWYLKRFRIKRYGNVPALKESLIGKIKSNIHGNSDSFYDYKATLILDSLLHEIVQRTCQDDENISPDTFIFHKEDFKKKFEGWLANASDLANVASERESLRARFIKCFERIESDIESNNWGMNLHKELMDTSKAMRDYLDEQSQTGGNPFVYQQFLQRLFNISNSRSGFPFDDSEDGRYLRRSLESLIYLLTLYYKVAYTSEEARLLFRKVLNDKNTWQTFSLYNVRDKKDMELAMKFVRLSVKDCSVSQDFKHDYYCFIADSVASQAASTDRLARLKRDSIHVSVSEPAVEESDSYNIKITKQTENIKFRSVNFIHEFFKDLKKANISSFKEDVVAEVWKEDLDKVFKQ